jgi:hypothetical protein
MFFVRLTNLEFAIREDNPILDGVRLTDAQKHRLTSQNEDCNSRKTFLGASSGTARGAKKKVFCEDTGIHVFGDVFGGFLIGVITWLGGPLGNCLV